MFAILEQVKMESYENHWLNSERIKVYSYIFLLIFIGTMIFRFSTSTGNFDISGQPLGSDFTSFYATAQLAVQGEGQSAYDFDLHFEAEKAAIGQELDMYYSFSYPPTFMLILAPLAFLPYIAAWAVWIGLSLAFFIAMVTKISDRKEAILVALAFPAVYWTIGHGQNALLTAGLLAGSLHYLDRKPIVAGILIGLMSFKPHLGVLIPFVLIIGGYWRVFFTAAITTLTFAFISWLAFGTEVWIAFFQSMSETSQTLNEGRVPFYKMQSLYASLRNANFSINLAYTIHGIFALFTFGIVIWIWSKPVDERLKKASLCIGTILMSPFMLSYDLAILAAAIAYLVEYITKEDFNPKLATLLFLTWVNPFVASTLSKNIPAPWTPVLLSFLLYQIILASRTQLATQEE